MEVAHANAVVDAGTDAVGGDNTEKDTIKNVQGKSIMKQEKELPLDRSWGSRFSHLSDEKDFEIEEATVHHAGNREVTCTFEIYNKKMGPVVKKPIKARNAQGTKNLQPQRNKQASKGPNNSSYLDSVAKNPKSVHVTTSSNQISEEEKRLIKEKEKFVLQRMKDLQSRGLSGLENLATQVYLPSMDSVVLSNIQGRSKSAIISAPKPPELVQHDDGGTAMIVESSNSSSLQPSSAKDVSHPGFGRLQKMVMEFFQSLYTEDIYPRPPLQCNITYPACSVNLDDLGALPSGDEIKKPSSP
ncbi:hypothetical protein RIF29_24841 [Crotalaria pallida]|uniref:Uncharacterized protein n=1 Tax=Crotalaria pallida TaxID=3830 RepID=A0AAN9I0J5_CROPI